MLKYVIFDLITPVVFSAPMKHRDVAKLGCATSGAYFLLSPDGEVAVGGESMSMDLKPGPHDAEILKRFFREGAGRLVNGGAGHD